MERKKKIRIKLNKKKAGDKQLTSQKAVEGEKPPVAAKKRKLKFKKTDTATQRPKLKSPTKDKKHLTDVEIRNAKPKSKPYSLYDNRGDGLCIKITPTGVKSWLLKYKFDDGHETLTFGRYPDISLQEARQLCTEAQALRRRGINPKKKHSATDQFRNIAEEWHKKQTPKWSDRYAQTIKYRLESRVYPYIGNKDITTITRPDISEMLNHIVSEGVTELPKRVLGYCSQIFLYALNTGLIEQDPTYKLEKTLPQHKPVPRAALTKPKEVSKLLQAMLNYQGTTVVRYALQFSALTFCRPGEVRQAEWHEFDFKNKLWTIPAHKTKMRKEHLVPLATQTLNLLKNLKSITGKDQFIFPALGRKERPMSDGTIRMAIRGMGFTKEEMSAHGFRAMASTLLHEREFNSEHIEVQLAHSDIIKLRPFIIEPYTFHSAVS